VSSIMINMVLSIRSRGHTPVHGLEIEEFAPAKEATDVKV
jgi:hypothetical protein